MIRSQRNPRVKTPQIFQSPLVNAKNWLWKKLNRFGTWAIWQYGGIVLAKDSQRKNLNSRKNKKAIRTKRMDRYFAMMPVRMMQKPKAAITSDQRSLA